MVRVELVRKIVTFGIIVLCVGVSILPRNIGNIVNQNCGNSKNNLLDITSRPVFIYSPKYYDFRYVLEGQTYQTTFEIWNGGTGILEWHLESIQPWISFHPFSDSSTGEHKTVGVTINTTNLSLGDYEGNLYIHSNAGDFIFHIYFIISNTKLSYNPTSYNFGHILENLTYQTTFEIWNEGTGKLAWHLESIQPWITFNPFSGTSTGEHETITVTVNTLDLTSGDYNESINITSNGGDDYYFIEFTINRPPHKPLKPSGETSGKTNTKYIYKSTTTDLDYDLIYYLFDWGDGTNSGWIGPYPSGETTNASHIWTQKDTYEIKVKAKDEHGAESQWSDPFSISIQKTKNSINLIMSQFGERIIIFQTDLFEY